MSKRRLSRQQARRIEQMHEQRLSDDAPGLNGLVIAHYGKRAEIEDDDGHVFLCMLRQNLKSLVTGDRVVWHLDDQGAGVITAVYPRDNELGRMNKFGDIKTIAANIDQLLIVFALKPLYATRLIDSYLVAAETLNIKPKLVLNKCDLLNADDEKRLQPFLDNYKALGYDFLRTSCTERGGLNELIQSLNDQCSVFVGQSGVGKSSLISELLPKETISIGQLSEAEHGRHTTTTTRMYHLPKGGDLIDSPGIREFGLWHMEPQIIAQGFIEFREFLGTCKFRDCQHFNEPDCALRNAVKQGRIHPNRLENYQNILQAKPT